MQLADGVGDLVVGRVEVRRNTYISAWAKIDKDLAATKFGGGFATVRDVEDDRADAGRGFARTADRSPTSSVRAMRRCVWSSDLARIAATPIFIDDLVAGTCRVHRRDAGVMEGGLADKRIDIRPNGPGPNGK